MSIGQNICRYRKKIGLTQLELAEKSSISRSYLGDLEKDRYNPSIDTLSAIASALNIEPAVLLGEKNLSFNPENITAKDKKDIARDINAIMEKISSNEDGPIYYNGEELDEEDAELFKDALEFALKRIKVENKQKYTPRKYRL